MPYNQRKGPGWGNPLAPVHFPSIKREPRARAYHSENPCAYISQNPRARMDSENSPPVKNRAKTGQGATQGVLDRETYHQGRKIAHRAR